MERSGPDIDRSIQYDADEQKGIVSMAL
jgi:hypothetical protein